MIDVKIDDTWHKADQQVVDRMDEYYKTMIQALKRLDWLMISGKNMRDIQKEYFSTFNKTLIPKAKALEKEFDDLLAGKTKPEEVQTELFR